MNAQRLSARPGAPAAATASAEVADLVGRLRVMGEVLLAKPEGLALGEIPALLEMVHRLAPNLRPDEAQALAQGINALETRLRAQQAAIEEELAHFQRGRKAIRGYGYLRSHKQGQRIRRKA